MKAQEMLKEKIKFLGDHEYIFIIVDYLLQKHGISFFITSKDFDVLYGWWEKKIPIDLVKKSIDIVKKRRWKREKNIDSFLNFSYEVRKNLSNKMELSINKSSVENVVMQEERTEEFYNDFPIELKFVEKDFALLRELKGEQKVKSLDRVYEIMINEFSDDEELNIKTEIFMSNLPETMRNSKIEKKFKINYLNRRFGIPEILQDK